MSRPAVNIVGVGNTLMGDDGLGPAAIEALARRRLPPGVALYDAGLGVSDVVGTLAPEEPLIVIDALRAGGAPGSVYEVALDDVWAEESCCAPGLSLHELSVVPALRMEALAGRQFRDVTVLGVEPARIGWGEGLSRTVADALEPLIEAVSERIDALTGSPVAGES